MVGRDSGRDESRRSGPSAVHGSTSHDDAGNDARSSPPTGRLEGLKLLHSQLQSRGACFHVFTSSIFSRVRAPTGSLAPGSPPATTSIVAGVDAGDATRRAQGAARLTRDQGIRDDTSVEKLAGLRALFAADGTVTAGNSSSINDRALARGLGRPHHRPRCARARPPRRGRRRRRDLHRRRAGSRRGPRTLRPGTGLATRARSRGRPRVRPARARRSSRPARSSRRRNPGRMPRRRARSSRRPAPTLLTADTARRRSS